MDRVLDITTAGSAVRMAGGLLEIRVPQTAGDRNGPTTIARLALSDIAAVMFSTEAATVSAAALAALAEAGIVVAFCRAHAPVAFLAALPTHERIAARQDAQLASSEPLRKRLWQALVVGKIIAQADVCTGLGLPIADGLRAMAARVGSGDPDNLEAQAAQRYWPALFGAGFTRERRGPTGIANAALNYGYIVLRALVARAVVAAGLLPSRGLAHRSAGDGLNLADDLMEPMRPRVDWVVSQFARNGFTELDPSGKRQLVQALLGQGYASLGENVTAAEAARRLVASLVESYRDGKASLIVPGPVCR